MSDLARKNCAPVRSGTPPLRGADIPALIQQLDGWTIVEEHHLTKVYRFPDFAAALAFVNRVGAIAEEENHHPDIFLAWGKVRIEIWTHSVGGLTENDFIFAAKCDEALSARD